MYFVDKNGKKNIVPSLNNWKITIKGFQTLFKMLIKIGIRSLLPRHVNQDSLECFFGAARSVSSSNPSYHAFASAYKTLLLNNLISSNAPGSNCEDFVETSLTSYKNLFQNSQDDSVKNFSNYEFSVSLPVQISNPPINVNYLRGQVQTYIAGYIKKKLIKTVFKNCHHCLKQLCANKVTNEHNLISARDLNTQRNVPYEK
ncbi:uncharacterized protein LOC126555121 [Aphis gossypii]|uniref:uncharacterized protein LOC126555121 n=1 Tax=Aphis gossypii TaxID=80765 RepID=UPI002159A7B7|nr:uncharacterized protein LOC126555121 [Aphis gossypii]